MPTRPTDSHSADPYDRRPQACCDSSSRRGSHCSTSRGGATSDHPFQVLLNFLLDKHVPVSRSRSDRGTSPLPLVSDERGFRLTKCSIPNLPMPLAKRGGCAHPWLSPQPHIPFSLLLPARAQGIASFPSKGYCALCLTMRDRPTRRTKSGMWSKTPVHKVFPRK